ncbi:MAG: hypothetical protein DRN19_04735, partial [Thermoplasmata archaeon]
YDALNRLKKVTDPLNQETVYTYDNRDNLIQLTDAKGQTTLFEYDKNNRLTLPFTHKSALPSISSI